MDSVKRTSPTMVLDASKENQWTLPYGFEISVNSKSLVPTSPSGITVTDNGKTGSALRNSSLLPFSLKGRKEATIRFFVEGKHNIDLLGFYFGTDKDYVGYRCYNLDMYNVNEGWNEISIDLADADENSTDFVGDIVTFQIRLVAKPNTYASVTFNSLFVNKDRRPSVVFTFDDGWTSQYEVAFPLLLAKGFKACVGVVPDFVGTEDYATVAQLQELHRFGWDLFNHTYTHPHLASKTAEQVVKEILDTKVWLKDHGLLGAEDLLAYPYGDFNNETVEALKPHIRYARTLVDYHEASYPKEPLKGTTRNFLNHSFETLKGYVDNTINTGGSLVFCGHRFGNTDTGDGMTLFTETFAQLLDYLYDNRDKIDVLTLSEWVNANE